MQNKHRRLLLWSFALVVLVALVDYWGVKSQFSVETLLQGESLVIGCLSMAVVCFVLAVVYLNKQEWTRRQAPYQVTIAAMLFLTASVGLALGLARAAATSDLPSLARYAATAATTVIFGGIVGAIIGHAFEGQRGGLAWRGALIGALLLAAPAWLHLAKVAYFEFVFFRGVNLG